MKWAKSDYHIYIYIYIYIERERERDSSLGPQVDKQPFEEKLRSANRENKSVQKSIKSDPRGLRRGVHQEVRMRGVRGVTSVNK